MYIHEIHLILTADSPALVNFTDSPALLEPKMMGGRAVGLCLNEQVCNTLESVYKGRGQAEAPDQPIHTNQLCKNKLLEVLVSSWEINLLVTLLYPTGLWLFLWKGLE